MRRLRPFQLLLKNAHALSCISNNCLRFIFRVLSLVFGAVLAFLGSLISSFCAYEPQRLKKTDVLHLLHESVKTSPDLPQPKQWNHCLPE